LALCASLTFLSVFLNSRYAVGDARFTTGDLVWVVAFLGFPTVGAFIASRRPGNPIGWLLCAAGVALGLSSVVNEYATLALLDEAGSLAGGAEAAWAGTWVWAPGFACIVLSVLLFPTGRQPTPRWWWVAAPVLVGMVLIVGPGAILAWSVRGPRLLVETQPGSGPLWVVATAGFALMVVALLAAVLSLLLRFRRAEETERQQIKWLAYAGAL
jgi:two-component system, NarL family, sensor kinase